MDGWVTRDKFVFEVPQNEIEKSKIEEHIFEQENDHPEFDPEVLKRHNEVTKVKNVHRICLGDYSMDAWYFSPFPKEIFKNNQDKCESTLYFCDCCLQYFVFKTELQRHQGRQACLRHPPGNEIYRSKEQNITISVLNRRGKGVGILPEFMLYCKLFLDHKP
eukprot:UN04988